MKQKNLSKEELTDEITKLKEEHAKLELENKILKKANELLKKEIGANYENLTNKEKVIVISALKSEYKLKTLLLMINLKKSTFYYEIKRIYHDKYSEIKELLKKIFYSNYSCYGYRRLKVALFKEHDIKISEKIIRKLMKELNLVVYKKKKNKYSSYKGEISPDVPNLISRNFKSTKRFEKILTDITEFSLCDGKVYLSPLIDCFDGLPIVHTICKSPNADLTNSMLEKGKVIIQNNKPIIHNDRDFHYRLPSWINLREKFGFIRSMSKKGCSPDNSMCEGFFGTIKNEFYYSRDWSMVKSDDFIIELEKYLDRFKTKRIKIRLLN